MKRNVVASSKARHFSISGKCFLVYLISIVTLCADAARYYLFWLQQWFYLYRKT